jgi:exopolysaccharide biosynthesis polyprenyl glycosylphosphotransferase
VILLGDATAALIAGLVAQLFRFGFDGDVIAVHGRLVSYAWVIGLVMPTWLIVLGVAGCYEQKHLTAGAEEYRRVIRAGVVFIALTATAGYWLRTDVSRGFVGALIPSVVLLTIAARQAVREVVHRRRSRGELVHRAVLVGSPRSILAVAEHLRGAPWAGLTVVGACTDVPGATIGDGASRVPVLGRSADVAAMLDEVEADTVIVTDAGDADPVEVRSLSWALEGRGIELIVAPAIIDVAGPRVAVRPVAGLPLLHVEEPRLSMVERAVKELVDRVGSITLLVFTSPLLLLVALAIRLDSRGPVFFRQQRVGLDGRVFTLIKFRSMVLNAESQRIDLVDLNQASGPLFKVHVDPRATRVGRVLRRFSIDELPQLLHVVSGKMSLVGPRPPLLEEASSYDHVVTRRLRVKPGMTGLWQVSGRSDLSWDESVRLDLFYIDHWSPTLDLTILLRTLGAVIKRHGAY